MRCVVSQKRGSALLIVLGLLSFLMISAVAFSISMRTERSAAAAYRRNLLARELLTTAFADARATTEYALTAQRQQAGTFDRNDVSTRTVEALAPFKYPSGDRYGRLISSRNNDTRDATTSHSASDEPIAYLLDDAMMRHVPPYIASAVYETLERQQPAYNRDGSGHNGLGNRYYIDWSAGWKPIVANIPHQDIRINGSAVTGVNTDTTIIGRMAWAVVNLSDSLDINAIGSASAYRGLGLTGSELAFGKTSSQINERYDLLQPATDINASEIDLPIFCSNADVAQFAARTKTSTALTMDSGNEAPLSWEEAVATKGDGFYSPFSVYGFWPNVERKKEDGARAASASSGTVISCNEVKESSISQASTGTGSELASLVNSALNTSGDAGFNLVRMLSDYIDKNSEPDLFDTGATPDLYNNAQPTVENVPMLAEVGFDAQGWESGGETLKKIEDAVSAIFQRGVYPDGKNEPVERLENIPDTLGSQTLRLELPNFVQSIALRGYFPGAQASNQNYTFTPEGFVGVAATTTVGGTEVDMSSAVTTAGLSISGSTLNMDGGASEIFMSSGSTPSITLKSSGTLALELKGDDLTVGNDLKAQPTEPKEIAITCLVDFFFRVAGEGNGAVIDLCPTDQGNGAKRQRSDYPTSIDKRVDQAVMARLDAQYFRITRPITITFSLKWKIEEQATTDGTVRYTAKAELADKPKLSVKCDVNQEVKLNGQTIAVATAGKASYLSLSDEAGTWYTIDPRYNWLSPMLGCSSDDASSYFSGSHAVRANFSSPHWIFASGTGGEVTSGNTSASELQSAYENKHQDIIPFKWGLKVEDVRYGHNDTGQLFLPSEIAFLPVPFATSEWHPNQRAYLQNSFASYHERVAKVSFFRTLPATDLKDGAMDYTKYVKLATLLKGFGGDNFPEEHRGIVNVFAGQDDYVLCQRLRQLAMLGIPPSIKQAAYVTYQRLSAAKNAKRVADGMVDSDLEMLKDLQLSSPLGSASAEPKYDEFITDYLFPLPSTSGGNLNNAKDWTREQTLYTGKKGTPDRPKNLEFIVQDSSSGASFADRLMAYNEKKNSNDKLGQNDMTTLLAIAKECFGDRQQLFLYMLRADFIAYNSARELSAHKPLSSARAVALVWRDAYGELPDRVIYYQLLP